MHFSLPFLPVAALLLTQIASASEVADRLSGRQVAAQSGCTTISGATVVCTSVVSFTFLLPSSTSMGCMSSSPAASATTSTSTNTKTISTPTTLATTIASSPTGQSPSSVASFVTSLLTTQDSVAISSTTATVITTKPTITSTTTSTTKSATTTTTTVAAVPSTNKFVFAHYMVGIAQSYTINDWRDDIAKAQAAHIDAFALNIASGDSWTDSQLPLAFQAAQAAGFKLFFSFDYGGGWSSSAIISKLQNWVGNSAYFRYKNLPFVSTFEGPGNAGDWPTIRASVPCFFVPDWASVGSGNFGGYNGYVDGAFSWDSWPTGANNMNTNGDQGWINALGSKPYMMGLSPWFYTNLPAYSKNWAWRGDSLFHDRWQQVYALQPQFVQIISWNDYGESHYIGPIRPSGIDSGATRYVTSNPHDAWRALLPYYIDAYKYGAAYPTVLTEQLVFWYRTAPVTAGNSQGTSGNAPWQPSTAVTAVLQDLIQVNALVKSLPATVTVQIGGGTPTSLAATATGMNHWAVPFGGQTGAVVFALVRNGVSVVTATGTPLLSAPADGLANFNAWVGSS